MIVFFRSGQKKERKEGRMWNIRFTSASKQTWLIFKFTCRDPFPKSGSLVVPNVITLLGINLAAITNNNEKEEDSRTGEERE